MKLKKNILLLIRIKDKKIKSFCLSSITNDTK